MFRTHMPAPIWVKCAPSRVRYHAADLRVTFEAEDNFGEPFFHLLHKDAVDLGIRIFQAHASEDVLRGLL